MATKSVKTTTRKTSATTKTTAPKVARARKSDADTTLTTAETAELATQPVHEMIALRAYEMWCARGHQHGHDVEDWLAAERELSTRN